MRWRYAHDEPWFDNQVASLVLEPDSASFVLEKTVPADGDDSELRLERVYERSLTRKG